MRGRLVGEHERRITDQGPGKRHPLLLTAREPTGSAVRDLLEVELREQRCSPGPGRRAARSGQEQRRHDVLGGREARHQVERLEGDADLSPPVGQARGTGQPGDGRATEDDLARRGGEQPREHAEQRRLAAAARTQCQHHLPVLGCEAQPLERAHRPARVVVLDGEAAHLQVGPDGAERGATPLGVGRMHGPNATVRGMRPRGNPRAPGRTGGDDVYSLSRWQPLRVVRARLLRAAVRRGRGGGAAALVERLPRRRGSCCSGTASTRSLH